MDESTTTCIDLHQDNQNPAHFLFYKNWESRELWQAHMSNQHLKDHIAATEGSVEEFIVNEMSQISQFPLGEFPALPGGHLRENEFLFK
jgi:quinol monooxygenase YgiN